MKDRFKKASNLDEPDEIMLLSDDEYEAAYDETLVKFSIEDEINDLLYQKDELESDNKKIEFLLNNETMDFYRVNELFDEIKYNQIAILRIDEQITRLKRKYDKLVQSSYQR